MMRASLGPLCGARGVSLNEAKGWTPMKRETLLAVLLTCVGLALLALTFILSAGAATAQP
jgi:hypothetical protein